MNGAALQVNNSGNADSQPQEFVGRRILVGEKARGLGDLIHHFFAPSAYFAEHAHTLKLRAALVHSGNAQVGASQVDPYGECRHTASCEKQNREVIITNRFNKTITKIGPLYLNFIEQQGAINARIGSVNLRTPITLR